MFSPFSTLACCQLSCRNFNLLCRIHFFRETVGRVQNIFLQKMCYCAETTMKLSGRRSSELDYIGLGQSDWYVFLICILFQCISVSKHILILWRHVVQLSIIRYCGFCTYSGPWNGLFCMESHVHLWEISPRPPSYMCFDLFSYSFLGCLTNASQTKLMLNMHNYVR